MAFQQCREASTLRKLLDTVEMHDDVTVERRSLNDKVDWDKDPVKSLRIIQSLSADLSRTSLFIPIISSFFFFFTLAASLFRSIVPHNLQRNNA